jgi:hypothetical protein
MCLKKRLYNTILTNHLTTTTTLNSTQFILNNTRKRILITSLSQKNFECKSFFATSTITNGAADIDVR